MSLIALATVPEGIVVAADRRSTTNMRTLSNKKENQEYIGLQFNDHTDKIRVCENDCVITNNGGYTLKGYGMDHWIRDFMEKHIHSGVDVTQMPELLLSYFQSFDEEIDTNFMIMGYDSNHHQRVYNISMIDRDMIECDTTKPYAGYCGESYYAQRLMQSCLITKQDGKQLLFQSPQIPFDQFTLDDAIAFCRFIIDMTKQMLDFVDWVNTVGGNTDLLVIKEEGVTWIQKEELV